MMATQFWLLLGLGIMCCALLVVQPVVSAPADTDRRADMDADTDVDTNANTNDVSPADVKDDVEEWLSKGGILPSSISK